MKSKDDGEDSPHSCASHLLSAFLPAWSCEPSLQPSSSASCRQNKQRGQEGGCKTQDGQEPFLPLFTAIFLQIFYCEEALLC